MSEQMGFIRTAEEKPPPAKVTLTFVPLDADSALKVRKVVGAAIEQGYVVEVPEVEE